MPIADAFDLMDSCGRDDDGGAGSNADNPIIRFAENYVRLPDGSPFRVSKTPYVAGIYDLLADRSGANKVVACMKGVQIALTTTAVNLSLYSIHERRSILFLLEDEKKVQKIVSERITPGFSRPPLRGMLERERYIGARGAAFKVSYEGGGFTCAGSHSPSSYSSLSLDTIIADEFARYKTDVGGINKSSGDPLSLLRNRMAAQGHRGKIFLLSTPLTPEDAPGTFANVVSQGDERVFRMPCAHCSGLMDWSNETWGYEAKDSRISCWHVCPHCNKKQREEHKEVMMSDSRARWVATSERATGSEDTASFRLPSFYAPTEFKTWHEIAKMAVRVERGQATEQVLYNEEYALPYDPGLSPPPEDEVMERWTLAGYKRGVVPEWGAFLTCGVDTQKDWTAYSVYAWSANGSSFLVETGTLDGSVHERAGQSALRSIFTKRYPCADGGSLPITLTAIDVGGNETAVKVFAAGFHQPAKKRATSAPVWRATGSPCVVPMRGSGRTLQTGVIDYVGKPDIISKTGGRAVCVVAAGVDIIKQDLYRALAREPEFDAGDPDGTATPYSHFFPEGIEPGVFEEITAEEMRTLRRPGTSSVRIKFEKKNSSIRNERLDTYCYARCAAEMLGLSSMKPAAFARMRATARDGDGDTGPAEKAAYPVAAKRKAYPQLRRGYEPRRAKE